MNRFLLLFLLVVVFSAMHGCDSDDRRLAEMANEASRRQAEQNVEMAQLNREVAANNRRVVESSNNITNLQRELQTERRDLANQHRHESLLAPIVATLGGILICVLPLVVCLRLFHALGDESTNDGMVELLLDETLLLPPSTTSAACPSLPRANHPALAHQAAGSTEEVPEQDAAREADLDGMNHADDMDRAEELDCTEDPADMIDRPF